MRRSGGQALPAGSAALWSRHQYHSSVAIAVSFLVGSPPTIVADIGGFGHGAEVIVEAGGGVV